MCSAHSNMGVSATLSSLHVIYL